MLFASDVAAPTILNVYWAADPAAFVAPDSTELSVDDAVSVALEELLSIEDSHLIRGLL